MNRNVRKVIDFTLRLPALVLSRKPDFLISLVGITLGFILLLVLLINDKIPKISKIDTEDIRIALNAGNKEQAFETINGYPVELIDQGLMDDVLNILKGDTDNMVFFAKIACRMSSDKILKELYNAQKSIMTGIIENADLSKNEDDFKGFYILNAIYNQKPDSLQKMLLNWYSYWESKAKPLEDTENIDRPNEACIYCLNNAYYTAYFLERMGLEEFSGNNFTYIRERASWNIRDQKLGHYRVDPISFGNTVIVKLDSKLKKIENIKLSKTPVLKDNWEKYKYEPTFHPRIIYSKKKALVYIEKSFVDIPFFLVELIDDKTLKIQTLED